MKTSQKVKKILAHYESDNPGTKANLARILMNGRLGGSGRLVILPVDQGIEHTASSSFAPNPDYFDPKNKIKKLILPQIFDCIKIFVQIKEAFIQVILREKVPF